MAETFADLALRPELVEETKRAGYRAPTALQSAAIPVLRRGGNAVLHASAGAGVVAAYGLALLDRLAGPAEAPGRPTAAAVAAAVGGLVLVPTDDAASRTATSLARFARPIGLRAAALGPDWPQPGPATDVVVAAPAAALHAVEASLLKLDGLRSFVLDDAAAILALNRRDAVEALTVSVPREAQRVVISAELGGAVDDYVERHVRRALHIPARVSAGREEARPQPAGELGYAVATEAEKLDTLARLLVGRGAEPSATVVCRTAERAAAVADALALRGFAARVGAGEGEREIGVFTPYDAPDRTDAWPISYDVPFDARMLEARHARGGVVLLEPRELPHLRRIAGEANLTLQPFPAAVPAPIDAEIVSYRERLRRAAREEDLAAQFVLLEPLLGELSVAEVAAAASALLRRRAPVAAAPAVTAPPPPARAWVRLFIGIGQRDGIRPGDLVGAITGETGAAGKDIGRIEIRDTFSIVDVASDIAERTIQALNGTTIKGRSVRVDYDRKAGTAR